MAEVEDISKLLAEVHDISKGRGSTESAGAEPLWWRLATAPCDNPADMAMVGALLRFPSSFLSRGPMVGACSQSELEAAMMMKLKMNLKMKTKMKKTKLKLTKTMMTKPKMMARLKT